MKQELIKYITSLNSQNGRLKGLLEALHCGDLPGEWRGLIRRELDALEEIPFPDLSDPEPIRQFVIENPVKLDFPQTGDPINPYCDLSI